MIVACPACGARYSVPEVEIPEAGRTLRCGACRAEWTHFPPQRSAPEPQPAFAAARAEPAEPAAPLAEPIAEENEGGRGRFGFMAGFALVALVAAAAVMVYLLREDIARAAPQLAAPLDQYAEMVDTARLWLRDQIAALTGR